MFAESYAKVYDKLNKDKDYKSEVEFVYQWAEKPKTILDIGCGTASYWKYFPKETQIVGIEKSSHMIRSKNVFCGNVSNFDFSSIGNFNSITALFDVINYIPNHEWWNQLPLKKGGYFIFDVWDKEKVEKDGFKRTIRRSGSVGRVIFPSRYDGKSVELHVMLFNDGQMKTELHKMYIFGKEDIEKFASPNFDIIEIKPTGTWQAWYKLKRK